MKHIGLLICQHVLQLPRNIDTESWCLRHLCEICQVSLLCLHWSATLAQTDTVPLIYNFRAEAGKEG